MLLLWGGLWFWPEAVQTEVIQPARDTDDDVIAVWLVMNR